MNDSSDAVVADNAAQHRYELTVDGVRAGVILYRLEHGVITLGHTEIAPESQRRGLGTRLVAATLDDVRRRGLRVVALCPFVSWYLRQHPENDDLVVDGPAT